MKHCRNARTLCAVLAASTLFGCVARQRPAVHLDPLFKPLEVGTIFVLPAVDARVDMEIEVDLDEQISGAAVSALQNRGYIAQSGVTQRDTRLLTLDELRLADATLIKELGPPESRWVMVVALVDVTTSLTFGSTGNAEVAGFLYDKEAGTILWRDNGVGQTGQGGVLGMALIGAMDEAAIAAAMTNLIASLPVREEVEARRDPAESTTAHSAPAHAAAVAGSGRQTAAVVATAAQGSLQ